MNNIQLNLTLEEINTMLEALGEMPYIRVYQLIAKIQQQATITLQQAPQQPLPEKNSQNGKPSESIGEAR